MKRKSKFTTIEVYFLGSYGRHYTYLVRRDAKVRVGDTLVVNSPYGKNSRVCVAAVHPNAIRPKGIKLKQIRRKEVTTIVPL